MPDIIARRTSDMIAKPRTSLRPLEPGLPTEVREWVTELRGIWVATELSLGQFSSLQPVDKGTISRYLNGERVPRDHWFLDKLLAILANRGVPVTPAVCEHLTTLHLRALQAAHPHEYRVRLVQDELEIAVTGRLEAERYARALEEQLAQRNREVEALAEDKTRLRAAWDAEHERLTRAIEEIAGQLRMAGEWAAQAQRRCALLEDKLERLDSQTSPGSDLSQGWTRSARSVGDGNGIEVRDSKSPDGTVLNFTPTAWNNFLSAAKRL